MIFKFSDLNLRGILFLVASLLVLGLLWVIGSLTAQLGDRSGSPRCASWSWPPGHSP
jgi:hypothetical protein